MTDQTLLLGSIAAELLLAGAVGLTLIQQHLLYHRRDKRMRSLLSTQLKTQIEPEMEQLTASFEKELERVKQELFTATRKQQDAFTQLLEEQLQDEKEGIDRILTSEEQRLQEITSSHAKTQLATIEKEIAEYKQEKIKAIDTQSDLLLKRLLHTKVAQSLTPEAHEELIATALKQLDIPFV